MTPLMIILLSLKKIEKASFKIYLIALLAFASLFFLLVNKL